MDTAPDDALAGLADAAVRYRIAVGPLAGQRTMRLRVPTLTEALLSLPGSLTASHDGDGLVVHELKRRFVIAPRSVCSSRWTFWPAWQPWCRAHGLISSVITACSYLTRVIARCWWRKRACVHPAHLMSPRLTPQRPR